MSIADDLGEVVAATVAAHRGPGLAAAVGVEGATHVVAHGVTSVETDAPLRPDTLFQVGSVSKTLTSALVALLVAEDRVAYEDPVAVHLPALATALEPELDLEAITVEHLLSHRSGFDGDHLLTHPEVDHLSALAGARHLFAPGAGYSYSNAAFSLAGELVATVEGAPFDVVARRRLLGPLGMTSACFRADDAITRSVAVPHWVVGEDVVVLRRAGWQPGWELARHDWAAGGLVASVEDLLRWGRFQLDGAADDGTVLLDAAARARLHTPVVEADQVASVGLDWSVRRTDGVTTIDHGGLTVGYSTDLVVVPERGVVVALACHATNGGEVVQAVRRHVLERVAGVVERDPEPDPDAVVEGDRVEGRYLHPFGVLTVVAGDAPGTIAVTTEARTDVTWQPPPDPPATFALTGPRDAVSVDGSGVARLLRLGEGWLQLGGRRAPRIDD
ncbi:beta-lactamase family protein [Iamia sp. SCSIO 61187]|uniref:serine hydrolase domain-containing protein n=1 Tax=Iamia sp. SCSIO 61187 TaxID=2722752 RepID=UPI001C625C00|nr:serine hydrolase domain-containing protein [Iamia sp. SCSIO 61187]QYG92071.1 beta-lactamase family protein [Iamia sp. SCSIO 61187]